MGWGSAVGMAHQPPPPHPSNAAMGRGKLPQEKNAANLEISNAILSTKPDKQSGPSHCNVRKKKS